MHGAGRAIYSKIESTLSFSKCLKRCSHNRVRVVFRTLPNICDLEPCQTYAKASLGQLQKIVYSPRVAKNYHIRPAGKINFLRHFDSSQSLR